MVRGLTRRETRMDPGTGRALPGNTSERVERSQSLPGGGARAQGRERPHSPGRRAQHTRCRHTRTILDEAHELIVIQHSVRARGRDQQGWDPRGAEVCQLPSWEQHPACSLHTPLRSSSLPCPRPGPSCSLLPGTGSLHLSLSCLVCSLLLTPHNLRSLLRRPSSRDLPHPR